MPRQSITFTSPNDNWLKSQVDSQEYSSKSEVINDLVRNARNKQADLEILRAALIEGENSGISERSPSEIMEAVIERKRKNGEI